LSVHYQKLNAGLSTDDECLYLQFVTQAIEDSARGSEWL